MISQVLFTSEQLKKTKMAFVRMLSQIKLLFGPLVIKLVWYVLKQLFTSVSVKVTSLPMCGFIAQLVEHRTGIRGGHGFESH